jgi:hypothetical protein
VAGSFHAQVSAWAQKSQARLTAVFRDSAQTVANEVRRTIPQGGAMPIDLGNLRRSLMASTSAMPSIVSNPDQQFAGNDQQINLVIAGAQIGQTVHLGFQANYAAHMEFGTSPHVIEPKNAKALRWYSGGASVFATRVQHPGTRPYGFVRTTAQRWQEIVGESAQRIQSRVESRAGG